MKPTSRDLMVARVVRDVQFTRAYRLDDQDITEIIESLPEPAELVKYGCHCDIENTVSGEPDECVFDNGDIEDCVYATQLQREDKGKLQCKYWKPVSRPEPAEPEQPAPVATPKWCNVHQHHKWCEHNGGVMGPTGYAAPDVQAQERWDAIVREREALAEEVRQMVAAVEQMADVQAQDDHLIERLRNRVRVSNYEHLAEVAKVDVEEACRRLADVQAQIDAAVAREREECARVAEWVWDSGNHGAHGGEQANRTATAIRARSAKGV